jgi:tetratricopeptide (TPR) repeat protein
MLAEVYHMLGDEEKADELIEQGADFAMQGEEHITIANVFMNLKQNVEKAREFFEKGLKDIRDKQQLIDYAKDIAEKIQDNELAMKFFKQAEAKAVAL